MSYGATRMKPKGEFGTWLANNIYQSMYAYSKIAESCKISKEHLSAIVTGRFKPSFQLVVTLCWVFGMKDDPNEIWKLVGKD